ncbi:efflux RND transporter periplasmic adaptor subunit [Flavisolibacter ginsenosidimutans]|uniref:Efflux RND transporter periplasmic adaptor subunit n=1 Tax=Flavisolibacter ginsenosidimutans TaxID=661481 RepID=A0A5B8UKN9_9BACT|nr:efflux RND transporter periplasmic adaptor subunit [Flavisolibacter ginsenosidimutans]QEC57118.1 efflux RND transporter periplasmic adaptor subunit [Flavisolibacter ginsenosidimutans]
MNTKNLSSFFVGLFAMLLVACGDDKKAAQQGAAPPPVYVSVMTVKDTAAVYYEEYPATLAALNEVKLTAQVNGYITGVYFKDGSKVSKGQRLYSIDQQVYGANLQQAIAAQQVQETNLLKAQKDAERYHELDKHDAIAKQQVDYADAALDAAKKQVAASRAAVAAVRANVGFAEIRAPFTGTIGISQVKAGTAVVAGQTVLNTVSTDDPVAVDINVAQQDIFRFTQLQQQKTAANDSTFRLVFGTDVYPYPGHVYLVDRAVDPQTGTIKTRLLFPNKNGMLKAGMNATVRVASSAKTESILIPNKAVTEQLGEYFTYVVGDSSKVAQHKVELGQQIGADVIVKSGLQPGDKIVVEGVQNLRQGAVITTTKPAPPAQQKK